MKIVITGATGYVGRHLVPILQDMDAELLLVGRDLAKLEAVFPSFRVCEYSILPDAARGYFTLVHLAVLNTDSAASEADFERVNVDHTLRTAELARAAGIGCFVNACSVHALDPGNQSDYARTKRLAAARLESLQTVGQADMNIVNLYLPYVYDTGFSERLRLAGRLPGPLGKLWWNAARALKPSVRVDRIAAFIGKGELCRPAPLSGSGSAPEPEPVILSDGQAENPVYRFARRTLDYGFVIGTAIVFGWLMIAIWAAVRLDSPGPGLFVQTRIGRGGRPFSCYKFRTMHQGTAVAATHEIGRTAITRSGGLLRRTKLDELPQIINIARNEMSLVGPRPCLPEQRELIRERRERGVLSLQPGITGLAQINGVDMRDPHRLARWDARYLALQSLLLDLKIIAATLTGKGRGDRTRR